MTRLIATVRARLTRAIDRVLFRPIERQAGRCWGEQ